LLPLPKLVAPDTTASLHEPISSDSDCLAVTESMGKDELVPDRAKSGNQPPRSTLAELRSVFR
jgi:hypothetical protein